MVEGSDGALRDRRERQLESSRVESKGQRHQQWRRGPVLGLRGARLDAGGGVGRALETRISVDGQVGKGRLKVPVKGERGEGRGKRGEGGEVEEEEKEEERKKRGEERLDRFEVRGSRLEGTRVTVNARQGGRERERERREKGNGKREAYGIQDQDSEGNRSDNRIRRGPQTARWTIDGGGEASVEKREGRRRRIRGKLVVCGIRVSKCPSLRVSYCMGGKGTRTER